MQTYVLSFCVQDVPQQFRDASPREFAEWARQVVDEVTIAPKASGTKAGDVRCVLVEFLGLNDREAKRTARDSIKKIQHVVGTDSGSLYRDKGPRPREFVAKL